MEFKRRRSQIHANNCSQTARKEAREGTTYETGVGINLNLDAHTSDSVTDTVANVLTMLDSKFKEIESFVSKYTPRPIAEPVNFNEDRYYNFLVFDTETNCTGKAAEICQLAATDISGVHTFSKYILPVHDIDYYASKVNKLNIINVKGERKLFKNNEMVQTLPFAEAISHFQTYVSQSIDRAKTTTSKPVHTVLIGHNVSTFDTPILLRCAGEEIAKKLQSQDIWFADSLVLFKALIKSKLPSLCCPDGTFPKPNQSSLYKALFGESFNAHDALEDVLALRKILFSSKLELSAETIVDQSLLVTVRHAVKDMNYLDRRHNIVQSFEGKLYDPATNNGPLTKNMVEKVAGSGLTYEDLRKLYTKYGEEGPLAILSKPPCGSNMSSPRVTRTNEFWLVL